MEKMRIRDAIHNIRMWRTRKKWTREAGEKQRTENQAKEALRQEIEGTCKKAAEKTERLCGSLVKSADLTSEERAMLVHGLETKIISARSTDKTQIGSDLQSKGLVDRLPPNKKTPLITRFVLTGKGNCVAKLAAGETVSECDCAETAVLQAMEQYSEAEKKKEAGFRY